MNPEEIEKGVELEYSLRQLELNFEEMVSFMEYRAKIQREYYDRLKLRRLKMLFDDKEVKDDVEVLKGKIERLENKIKDERKESDENKDEKYKIIDGNLMARIYYQVDTLGWPQGGFIKS